MAGSSTARRSTTPSSATPCRRRSCRTDPSARRPGQMDLLTGGDARDRARARARSHRRSVGGDLMSDQLVDRRAPAAETRRMPPRRGADVQPERRAAATEIVGHTPSSAGSMREYYLAHNPDVAAAGVDPLAHFDTFGWHEGRNPNAFFDTAGYLAHYADVAAAGVNPLQHYEAVRLEGRPRSVGELRHAGLSGGEPGCGGGARQPARPLSCSSASTRAGRPSTTGCGTDPGCAGAPKKAFVFGVELNVR